MNHSLPRSLLSHAAAPFPLVTLKSLLESPTNSIAAHRQYRKHNSVVSMNGKKDLAGQLSSNGLTGLSPASIAAGTGQSGWPVDVNHFESAAAQAFLGPSIWDKSNPYDSMGGPGGSGHDFKLEYMDLDEFLSENGLGNAGQGTTSAGHPLESASGLQLGGRAHLAGEDNKVTSSTGSKDRGDSPGDLNGQPHMMMSKDGMHIGPEIPGDFSMSPADLALATVPGSTHNFDPRRRRFSEEELKPQPMVKKSKKQFVPDDMKDEKYWARRRKNNLAAKRSRDARRVKENQIAIRASYLEKENAKLREQLDKLTRENMLLRDKLVSSVPKGDSGKNS